MTDAFRCDGCDEYYDDDFQFVTVEFDSGATRLADFTIDDVGSEAYSVADEVDLDHDTGGDFCPDCGREVLENLIELFGEVDA